MSSLSTRAIKFYQQFMLTLEAGADPSPELVEEWEALDLTTANAVTPVSDTTRLSIAKIANNVLHHTNAMLIAKKVMGESVDELSGKLDNLFVSGSEGRISKRKLDTPHPSTDHRPTTKRQCRPLPSDPSHPSNKTHHTHHTLPPPPPQTEEVDPVRLFFLQNISFPYPTPSQKDALCRQAKITKRKLESDLTNWRRRSEWTEMMNVYCAGDKGLMKRMIEDIERGEDLGEEIKERYGRMKGYLEKKDEQPGQWVYELAEMVQNGQIDDQVQSRSAQAEADNMRLVEVEIGNDTLERFSDSSDPGPDNSPEGNTGTESDTETDVDADAEGESEADASSLQNQSAGSCITIGAPSTGSCIMVTTSSVYVPAVTRHSSLNAESAYGSVPESGSGSSSEISVSPISFISPTAGISRSNQVPLMSQAPLWLNSTVPSDLFTTVPLPDRFPSQHRAASTKSSYSSLSAVSNLAQSSHSRTTSGSTSLRSVSSSSSNPPHTSHVGQEIPIDPRLAHLKRPAPAESFARSSRSRVEDILTEEPASWALGYFPSHSHPSYDSHSVRPHMDFHIGGPPLSALSLPYVPFDGHPQDQTQGYTGNLTPYMMTPAPGPESGSKSDAWSTGTSFAYLPHISQIHQGVQGVHGAGYASFDMPPEYEFTFTQEPTTAK